MKCDKGIIWKVKKKWRTCLEKIENGMLNRKIIIFWDLNLFLDPTNPEPEPF